MGSIFDGTPQSASSYSASTSETPKWMQDAIYNQVNWAQNIANKPYDEYALPTVAELSPLQQQAYTGIQDAQGAYKQNFNKAQAGMEGMSNPYLQSGTSASGFNAANPLLQQAAGASGMNAANPYMNQSQSTTAQALADKALNAANPYLQQASQSSVSNIDQYMNPYQTNVMDAIAQQGTRNLTENLLPGVSDSFIRAGQFGSRGMGEFGSRALRDTVQ